MAAVTYFYAPINTVILLYGSDRVVALIKIEI